MYSVLLVDDEYPTLNYFDAIVRKYLPDFEVCGMAEDAQSALHFLSKGNVDVMVTDISMPGEMNGIDLAKAAKEKYPSLHVVIVSGFAEFEYARGALQAGVEDYLLKPISIKKVKEIMEKVRAELDEGQLTLRQRTFADLVAHKEMKSGTLERSFGRSCYYFAIVRFGNLCNARFSKLMNTLPCHLNQPEWLSFYGHDEEELILLISETYLNGSFPVKLTGFLQQIAAERSWTAIYDIKSKPIRLLPAFLDKAYALLNVSLVIGYTQCLPITSSAPPSYGTIPSGVCKQLSSFMMSNSLRAIQELFLSLAVDWEKNKVPQEQLEHLCFQLINLILAESEPAVQKNMKEITSEASALYASAGSIGEVLSGLYGTLLGDLTVHDRKISGEELCEHTLSYIREHYALPLSIQSVCSKIGFSQTYLSRLLRKYANTSVNTYLTQCRIEAAKEMLKNNPSILLRDVASSVGYDDQSYFNKIFRNETGMTPKQYTMQFEKRQG